MPQGTSHKLTTAQIKKLDDWFSENIIVNSWGGLSVLEESVPTRYTPRRLGAQTHHYNTYRPVKVPFKAPTLASYLALKRPDLIVKCDTWSKHKGRQAKNGIYYSRSTHNGYRIEVRDTSKPLKPDQYGYGVDKFHLVFSHDTMETYRTQAELALKIAELITNQMRETI